MMSDPRATMPHVRPSLENLITLATKPTTQGQLEYVDVLLTQTIRWAKRPDDIERLASVIHELVSEVAAIRATVNA